MDLAELFLEIALTSQKHIIVEGRTDENFFKAWLQDADPAETVVVTPVENLEVGPDEVLGIGLSDGNRSRVVYVAMRAEKDDVDLRCVADRDCGHNVETHNYEQLLWTDYPSIESYALDGVTLQKANLLSFNGRLPDGGVLLGMLVPALRDLYAVRAANEHLERPNYAAGVGKNRSLATFNVSLTVHPSLRSQVAGYAKPTSRDPREFAYGHDIGELLLAAFGNVLKNNVGLVTLGAVEAALRSAVQAVGSYKTEPLFIRLHSWISA
ncbi:hypothetical protein [Pseudarthrobacter sp. W1I19]|uniref:hypothetical protein n=1 Tax=Pseudarthrobacter sp. W1I19 TaxID=3042288 RepID=UPI0027D8526C|nr:hypothetical protein [Pseudarthrobacter sp. W1I19]